jgi:hypothetical protein
MCEEEFGAGAAADLALLLTRVEPILTAIYTVNNLYYGRQSTVWMPGSLIFNLHRFTDLFQPPGAGQARAMIEAAGARVHFLPSYSPDLNPIEKMWSKIAEFLRAAKART